MRAPGCPGGKVNFPLVPGRKFVALYLPCARAANERDLKELFPFSKSKSLSFGLVLSFSSTPFGEKVALRGGELSIAVVGVGEKGREEYWRKGVIN